MSVPKIKRWLKRLAILVVIAALGYGVVTLLGAMGSRPGFAVPDLGAGHIEQQGCTPHYNSSPPTSGCHSASAAPYGPHEDPIDEKLQVHNLEHGGVIIQYRSSGIIGADDALAEELQSLVNRLRGASRRYCRLIVAPYPYPFEAPNYPKEESSQKVIALTAWGRMELLDGYDEKRIRQFIDTFINKGPEQVAPTECS